MTKTFCDLCESPAEDWPTMRVDFPEKSWRGNKEFAGSISPTDGTWTPHVEARVVFELHDMPRTTRAFHPDLCPNCVAGMMRTMADSITRPPLK